MTSPDPRSISETLRRVIDEAKRYHEVRGDCDEDCHASMDDRDTARVLADRLAIEGPPRVGDIVRMYSMKDSPENYAVAVEVKLDSVKVAFFAGGPWHTRWFGTDAIRVVARSPWSLDDLEQTR